MSQRLRPVTVASVATERSEGERERLRRRGGRGHAGHIEPAMALADAVRRLRPDAVVTALGTESGLDTRLIPARGYPLELIPPVPLPRKPSADLLRLPAVWSAVSAVRDVLREGRRRRRRRVRRLRRAARLPRRPRAACRSSCTRPTRGPGLANKIGARFAARVAAAVPGHRAAATPRSSASRCAASVTSLDRAGAAGPGPREVSACPPTARCCWSSAARRAPARSTGASPRRCPGWPRPGSGCCTRTGQRRRRPPRPAPGYVAVPYIERWTWPTPPPTWCCAGPGR